MSDAPHGPRQFRHDIAQKALAELRAMNSSPDASMDPDCMRILRERIAELEDHERQVPAAVSTTQHTDEASLPSQGLTDADTLEEIKAGPRRRASWVENIVVLVLSLIVFAGTGLFSWKPAELAVLLIVLLIHESGHFLAMKLSGYRDVRMFFIPGLGAAVTGKEGTPHESRKALVAIAGPLPGLAIGLVLAVVATFTGDRQLYLAAAMFVFLNAFNLLPLFPLDGGKYFESVLFTRNFVLEAVFKVVTALLLLAVAAALKSWLLLIFMVGMLLSLRSSFLAAKAAAAIRRGMSRSDIADAALNESIVGRIRQALPPTAISNSSTLRQVAVVVEATWNRVHSLPPGVVATVAFLVLYCGAIVLTAVDVVALVVSDRASQYVRVIGQAPGETSFMVDVEKFMLDTALAGYIQLRPTGQYDGFSRFFNDSTGRVETIGHYVGGVRHGQWSRYDSAGAVIEQAVFDRGKVESKRDLKDGKWVEYTGETLPPLQKAIYWLKYRLSPHRAKNWKG